ncbi:MAG: hypothetical protein GTN71_00255 [Anaerolineae bacterium]|nr:hypothetical protein [Anaerolineae bacterium]
MTTPNPPRRRPRSKVIRRERIPIKATSAEKTRWRAAAAAEGLSLGAWLARLADLASGLSGGSETGE